MPALVDHPVVDAGQHVEDLGTAFGCAEEVIWSGLQSGAMFIKPSGDSMFCQMLLKRSLQFFFRFSFFHRRADRHEISATALPEPILPSARTAFSQATGQAPNRFFPPGFLLRSATPCFPSIAESFIAEPPVLWRWP